MLQETLKIHSAGQRCHFFHKKKKKNSSITRMLELLFTVDNNNRRTFDFYLGFVTLQKDGKRSLQDTVLLLVKMGSCDACMILFNRFIPHFLLKSPPFTNH